MNFKPATDDDQIELTYEVIEIEPENIPFQPHDLQAILLSGEMLVYQVKFKFNGHPGVMLQYISKNIKEDPFFDFDAHFKEEVKRFAVENPPPFIKKEDILDGN